MIILNHGLKKKLFFQGSKGGKIGQFKQSSKGNQNQSLNKNNNQSQIYQMQIKDGLSRLNLVRDLMEKINSI